jgi:hypothetical protein
VSRRKRERVEGAGEDADTLDTGVEVDEPVVVDADADAELPRSSGETVVESATLEPGSQC